jgi:hypothetical protein
VIEIIARFIEAIEYGATIVVVAPVGIPNSNNWRPLNLGDMF